MNRRRMVVIAISSSLAASVAWGGFLYSQTPDDAFTADGGLATNDTGPPSDSVESDPTVPPTSATPSTQPTVAPVGSVGGADPLEAATRWMTAFGTLSWTDQSGAEWQAAIGPYVTDQLAAQYAAPTDGTGGIGWSDFVDRKCTSSLHDVGGVIPDGAPRTDSIAYVSVMGAVKTTCADGDPPDQDPVITSTVEVVLSPAGRWLVNAKLS